MTQLVELRDAYPKFLAAGVRLYAISYDDPEVLRTFAEKCEIPYPLLSDLDSEVIRRYGILNDQVGPEAGPLYGIPYPGSYVTDEDGAVVAKFFRDSYKKRESPEVLIDAALGEVRLDDDAPSAAGGDEEIRVSATFHGGPIKQGAQRQVVVRFELPPGLHVYGEPVPEGMIPTTVTVRGPEGLVVEETIAPPTETLRLDAMDLELPVWSGRLDLRVPVWARAELVSECRALEARSTSIEVEVRYQACDDEACLLPKNEKFTLEVPLQEVDVQNLSFHGDHGQRVVGFDARPHMRRLFLRKVKANPLGLLKFAWKNVRLEREARKRRRAGS